MLSELCQLFKIEKQTSTAYHHQSLGQVERVHRTLNQFIRSYILIDNLVDWDKWFQYFTYCFNTTLSIVHGYRPYELVFGKTPNRFKEFENINKITPLYNKDDYSIEVRYMLEIAHKRARKKIEKFKIKQKSFLEETYLYII